MEREIKDVLSSQNKISNLINMVGKNYSNQPPTSVWMSPGDKSFRPVQVRELAKIQDVTTNMSSVVKFMQEYDGGWRQHLLGRNRRFKSTLLQFNPISYPKQVLKCPTVEEIQALLSSEHLSVSLYSYSGYSFSNEFTQVYKGKFNKETALEDLLVILQRALQCTNPSISGTNCVKYANFIARIAPWEMSLARSVLEETSRGLFPDWAAHPTGAQTEYDHVEIYLGHNPAGEMSFTVRTRFEVVLKAVPVGSKEKTTPPASAAPNFDPNTAVESIYYREFVLNDSTIDAFSRVSFLVPPPALSGGRKAGQQQLQVPPPPPKRSGASDGFEDIQLYLLVSHKVTAVEAIATEQEEVPVEIDEVPVATSVKSENDEETLDEKSHIRPSPKEEVSFCAELYGWGFDSGQSLGLGAIGGKAKQRAAEGPSPTEQEAEMRDMVHGPRKIPLDRLIAAERVRMLACSSNHTLLLTCMGSVFSCGDNSEGALGTGDLISR